MNRTTGIGMPLTRSSTAFTRRSRHSPHLSADYADGFTDAALDAREWEMENTRRAEDLEPSMTMVDYMNAVPPEPEIHNTFRECLSKAVAALVHPVTAGNTQFCCETLRHFLKPWSPVSTWSRFGSAENGVESATCLRQDTRWCTASIPVHLMQHISKRPSRPRSADCSFTAGSDRLGWPAPS